MALKFRIDSLTVEKTASPPLWHLNVSIIDDTAPSVVLDHLNLDIMPSVPANVTAAKNTARTRYNKLKQFLADQATAKAQVQTVLTSIEQGG